TDEDSTARPRRRFSLRERAGALRTRCRVDRAGKARRRDSRRRRPHLEYQRPSARDDGRQRRCDLFVIGRLSGGRSSPDRGGRDPAERKMNTTDDALAYPGEFEVLRTKAEAGLWDSGHLVLTNYRLSWTPSRLAKTPAFSIDLSDIASVRQVRLPVYLFLSTSLRFRLRDGAVYEIHRPLEDVNR